jgi:phosphinothricin acetyltransferase
VATVRVREAVPSDVPAICALFNALVPTSTVAWRDHPTSEAEQLAWLAERQAMGQPTLVADDGGAVVGYCCWTSFRGGDRFPGYRHTVEHTVHVRSDRQGRGIGRLLMTELVDRARIAGVHVMVAAIDGDNESSITFHAGLGFVEVGRLPQTGRKFERWLDLVLMQRIIPS